MKAIRWIGRHTRKAAILVVGVTVVLAGIALLALPGPGMLVIIVGLLILSQEFEWAERWLDIAVEKTAGATSKVQESRSGRIALGLSGAVLIVAGVAVIVVWSTFRFAGASLILAGVIGLSTLHPRVQAWIGQRALTGINATDDVD